MEKMNNVLLSLNDLKRDSCTYGNHRFVQGYVEIELLDDTIDIINELKAELIEVYEIIWFSGSFEKHEGWQSHSFTRDQEHAAKRLVELGAYEKHPTEEWFREKGSEK